MTSGIDALTLELTQKVDTDLIADRISAGLPQVMHDAMREILRECIATADPHRTWLAEIDRIAQKTDDIKELREVISAYLRQSGITRLTDINADKKSFVITGKVPGGTPAVYLPAYIDSATRKTILSGRARLVAQSIPAEELAKFEEDDVQ